jgi:hypothetical protein
MSRSLPSCIHGNNTGVGPVSLSPNSVHIATAHDAMERIGKSFAYGFTFLQDNCRICALLVDDVKPLA